MAHFVLTNASLVVNSVDLSDHCKSLSGELTAADEDDSNMGDTSVGRLVGLRDGQLQAEFSQDFAASEVDATLWAIYNGGVAVTVTWKPVNTTTSGTNPEYSGSFILTSYTPVGGEHGAKAMAPVTFLSDGAITRGTGA